MHAFAGFFSPTAGTAVGICGRHTPPLQPGRIVAFSLPSGTTDSDLACYIIGRSYVMSTSAHLNAMERQCTTDR